MKDKRKAWFKLYPNDLRSTLDWKHLSFQDRGAYLQLMTIARLDNPHAGCLVYSDGTPLTIEEIAFELDCRAPLMATIIQKLIKYRLIGVTNASKPCYFILRFAQKIQKTNAKVTQDDTPATPQKPQPTEDQRITKPKGTKAIPKSAKVGVPYEDEYEVEIKFENESKDKKPQDSFINQPTITEENHKNMEEFMIKYAPKELFPDLPNIKDNMIKLAYNIARNQYKNDFTKAVNALFNSYKLMQNGVFPQNKIFTYAVKQAIKYKANTIDYVDKIIREEISKCKDKGEYVSK